MKDFTAKQLEAKQQIEKLQKKGYSLNNIFIIFAL